MSALRVRCQAPAPGGLDRPGGGAMRAVPSAPASAANLKAALQVDRPAGGGSRLAPTFVPLTPLVAPLVVPERPGGRGGSRMGMQPPAALGGGGGGGGGSAGGGGGGDDGGGTEGGGAGSGSSYALLFVGWVGACTAAYAAHGAFFAPSKGAGAAMPCCAGKRK